MKDISMKVTIPVRLTEEDITMFASEHFKKKEISGQLPQITEREFVNNMIDNFRKDHSSQMLHTYLLSSEGISNESRNESSILHWEEIHYFTEYVTCFVIKISSIRINIIPRRCFENEQQLRNFRSIVSSNIPASKWLLIGIPLGLSKPDAQASASIDSTFTFTDQKNCIYSITFQANDKEAKDISFSMLLHSRSLKKIVIPFIILFGILIWISSADLFILSAVIFAGVVLFFQLFFVFRKASLKLIKTDKCFSQEVTFSFFSDRFVSESISGQAEFFWNKIFQIEMRNTGLFIYFHPELVSVIPIRVINSMQHKKEFIDYIKSREIVNWKRK